MNGQRGRLASATRWKDAGIRDVQIGMLVTAAVGINDRYKGIVPHAACAEDMGRRKMVPGSEFLDQFRCSRFFQQATGVAGATG